MDMCIKAGKDIGATNPVPSAITSRSDAVTAIRNPYEHIEDRALDKVKGKPHIDALTIFDHASLLADGVITYGLHKLDLTTDVPEIISSVRQFLKTVAGDALPALPRSPQSIAVAMHSATPASIGLTTRSGVSVAQSVTRH